MNSSKKGNKIATGAIRETMCGAETEVKATQRLPYLGIHPINSQQILTLLWTTSRTMILATQTPQDSHGLSHQSRGIHGSSQKCGRGRPCWASVGGMVLGQVNTQQRPEQGETEEGGRRECVGWRGIFVETGGRKKERGWGS